MKLLLLISSLFIFKLSYAQDIDYPGLFNSQAMSEICSTVVKDHPTKPGFWLFHRPSFAYSETRVFASVRRYFDTNHPYEIFYADYLTPDSSYSLVKFDEAIRDIEFLDNRLWVLLSERLIAIDPITGEEQFNIKTHTLSSLPRPSYRAYQMVRVENKLAIAHGAQGLVIFDIPSLSFTQRFDLDLINQKGHHTSKAVTIASMGKNQLMLGIEAATISQYAPFAFTGLKEVDITEGSFTMISSPYHRQLSGQLTNAHLYVSEDTLYINNSGILQSVPLEEINGEEVRIRGVALDRGYDYAYVFPSLMGDFVVANNRLHGCLNLTYHKEKYTRPTRMGIALDYQL